MNLHEECLLNYLLNPLRIASTTEILKVCNKIVEKEIKLKYSPKVIKAEVVRV